MTKLHLTCFFGNNKKWELELSKKICSMKCVVINTNWNDQLQFVKIIKQIISQQERKNYWVKIILELKIKLNGDLYEPT